MSSTPLMEQWAADELVRFGINKNDAEAQLLPYLFTFQDSDSLITAISEIIGKSREADRFADEFAQKRFPSTTSSPYFKQNNEPSKKGEIVFASNRGGRGRGGRGTRGGKGKDGGGSGRGSSNSSPRSGKSSPGQDRNLVGGEHDQIPDSEVDAFGGRRDNVYRKDASGEHYFVGGKKSKSPPKIQTTDISALPSPDSLPQDREEYRVSRKAAKVERQQQERDAQLAKGREGRKPCRCYATVHPLFANCLTCGYILCEEEGHGPCYFCDTPVISRNQQLSIAHAALSAIREREAAQRGTNRTDLGVWNASKNNSTARMDEREMDEAVSKALLHKEKLLEFDKTFERRTRVIDQAADFTPSANASDTKWMSESEKRAAVMRAREEQARQEAESQRSGRANLITLDLAGGKAMEETGVARRHVDLAVAKARIEAEDTAHYRTVTGEKIATIQRRADPAAVAKLGSVQSSSGTVAPDASMSSIDSTEIGRIYRNPTIDASVAPRYVGKSKREASKQEAQKKQEAQAKVRQNSSNTLDTIPTQKEKDKEKENVRFRAMDGLIK